MVQNESNLNDLDEKEQLSRDLGEGWLGEWRKYSLPALIGLAVILFLLFLFLIAGGSEEEKQAGKGANETGSVEARLNKLEFQHQMLMEDVNEIRESGMEVSQKELSKLRKAVADLEKRLAGLEDKLKKDVQPRREADAGEERAGTSRSYTVEEGDTLFGIGQEYDVTVEQLREWNDLSAQDYIHPGQELKVAE
jgi:LysM repeat protein